MAKTELVKVSGFSVADDLANKEYVSLASCSAETGTFEVILDLKARLRANFLVEVDRAVALAADG